MLGRADERVRAPGRGRALRRLASAIGIALAGTALGVTIVAGPASASPTPHYASGSDTATFTVSGLLDRNCLVRTGGNHVFIKPGDSIRFNSSLLGVDVAGLNAGNLAGLNVSAVIDDGTSSRRLVRVVGGKSVDVDGLSIGRHTLAWTATGVPVASGLLSGNVTHPLRSDDLGPGAKLTWAGEIYVTDSAPNCTYDVSSPKVGASVGPAHVAAVPGKSSVGHANILDLSSSNPESGSAQLPVLLAIIAIIALAIVAGTYARMFLLRKP